MRFPEQYRTNRVPPVFQTKPGTPQGVFLIPGSAANGRLLRVIACADPGSGWEHASVTVEGSKRPPGWQEMCAIKNLFWEPGDCVVQYHPPESDYVNNHPGCLHLWRHPEKPFPMPPIEFV